MPRLMLAAARQLAVLLVLATAWQSIASAHAPSLAETRVRGFELVAATRVGAEPELSRETHSGIAEASGALASDSLLAAEAGAGRAGYAVGEVMANGARAGAGPGTMSALEEAQSIVFGHGARHLAGTGVGAEAVEGVITQSIRQSIGNASATGSFWGRVQVQDLLIEYRAFTLENGAINVGTYYPIGL